MVPHPSRQDQSAPRAEHDVLGDVLHALAAEPALDRVGLVLVDAARRALRVDRSALWRLDAEHSELHLVGSSGVSSHALAEIGVLPLTAPMAATQAARTGQPCEIPDVHAVDMELSLSQHLAQRESERSVFAQPLIAASRVVGVLGVSSTLPRRLSSDERALLGVLADAGALALAYAAARDESAALRDLRLVNDRLVHHATVMERRADEAEQARSQQAAILDRISDGFCALDRTWRFTYLNDESERLFRQAFPGRPDQLLGEVLWDALPDAMGTVFERELRRAMTDQVTSVFAMYFPDTGVWLEDQVYPTPDGLSVYCRDITERKRMEDALRQSEASLARAQEVAHLGNWERDLSTGRLWWSDEIHRIFGITPHAFAGNFAAFLGYVHPDDRGRVQAALREALQGNRSYSIDHRIVRPDGVVGVVHEAAEVVRDAAGEPVRLVGTVQDITERKQAEDEREEALRQLADERAWLRAVIESSPVGIILVQGAHAERVIPNQRIQELCGHTWTVEGMTAGDYLWQLANPDGTPLALDDLAGNHALRGEVVRDRELLLRQPSGAVRNVLVSASQIRDAIGTVIGAVVVYQDVTRIRDLERQREEWAWAVAHDLRQPATIIMGYASLLARGLSDRGEQERRKAADHVLSATRTLSRMIDDLVDVSRIEAQQLTVTRTPLDLPALVRAVVGRVAGTLPSHAIQVEVRGEVPTIEADARRIEQVVSNLLANAAQYGAPDTEIRVAVETRDGAAVLSVTNQGPGIASEDVSQLFTRFYRTRDAREGRATGLGLGLYISKGIVEAHGGSIWAESAPGQTTTFHVTLPLPPTAG